MIKLSNSNLSTGATAMKSPIFTTPLRTSLACCAFATLLLFAGSNSASAQWTTSDTIHAWAGMNNNFLYQDSSGYDHFAETVGGSTQSGFWQQAEEIEMAVDAYVWSEANDSSNLSGYSSELTSLINGFNTSHASWWNGADTYDDDMMWATIAFARASHVLSNSTWLTDAEDAFNTVYNRGLASNGGIYWNSAGCSGHPATGCSNSYENSAANWTFVIAGHLINNYNGGTGDYLSEAESVYTWANANLYQSSTGQIYDGYFSSSGPVTGAYTYNYGTAIGAASEQGDSATITNVANYLMYDLGNYAGTTSGGYNILANYGQSAGDNDGGYNGIVMRWLGTANAHGYLSSTVQAWALANITQAWSIRDGQELMWDDWAAQTPATSGKVYSWDCSSAMVGMFDEQGF
jgi:predicted alpha-1,6-mannanase (GH76 family)